MPHLNRSTPTNQRVWNFARKGGSALISGAVPQLLLAAFLHLAPIGKALHSAGILLPSSPAAVVLRWAAAIAALVGTYHTVSAASAAIVGLTKYTNNTPLGGPTDNAVVTEDGVFRYRITVSNAGSDHKKDYFACEPMPPGLTMNTNVGGNGFITNKPNAMLVAGVYHVRLYAGNTSYPRPVTYDATITVLATGIPPRITNQPANQIAFEGQAVAFTVGTEGTGLTYEWFHNSSPVPGKTNSLLSIPSVAAQHAGTYTVRVSNSLGAITSDPALLTVSLRPALRLEHPRRENSMFVVEAADTGAAAYILWTSSDFALWSAVATNTATSGMVRFSAPIDAQGDRFYSLSAVP